MKTPIENLIYAGMINILEDLEHRGIYNGNGHHLAQKLTSNVSYALLPRQQKIIFDALSEQAYKSTGQLAKEIELPSKNVSSQLRQIYESTLLISFKQNGKLKEWKKNSI